MSFPKTKCVDVEVSQSVETLEDLEGYAAVRALVRVLGTPVGFLNLSVVGDHVSAASLRRAIVEELSFPIFERFAAAALEQAPLPQKGFEIADLVAAEARPEQGPFPPVTVAVCTRNRTAGLAVCLESLLRIDYPNFDVLVVDNAPSDDATQRLVGDQFPSVRHVLEPRPGLDWARNRAVLESGGEILAYTDDDVVVDRGWIRALVGSFNDDVGIVCVTGLVIADELDTEAQQLFELYGGFGRGFQRGWFRKPYGFGADDAGEKRLPEVPISNTAMHRILRRDRGRSPYFGTGALGTGCNMAYRRSFLEEIGGFDPALDVGTPTNGGGDLEMYFRVLREGYTLAYEPGAIVRHRHRRERERLKTQIQSNGVGLFSFFLRIAQKYPDERLAVARFAIWWIRFWHVRRLFTSLFRPGFFPLDLILAELTSVFKAPRALHQSRTRAREIAAEFPDEPFLQASGVRLESPPAAHRRLAQAVRTTELSQPLGPLTDIDFYPRVLVLVSAYGQLVGGFELQNNYQNCGVLRLREGIVKHCSLKLLKPYADSKGMLTYSLAVAELLRKLEGPQGSQEVAPPEVSSDIPVSVVVATRDRPDDLRLCLKRLTAQQTSRPVQIIVVDNAPQSGITRRVVAEFAGIELIDELRPGVSYARNTGFAAATGEIILSTDDDVTVPPSWVESMVAPFARNDVMIVCGNVIPVELETAAQHLYEIYGGLGRGYVPWEADSSWFRMFRRRSVPVWQLGATANGAFRAEVMRDPRVGMLEECLGCGMPSEGSEDNYFLYKALKAGMKIVYEPSAHVYHRHRADLKALKKQLFGYSKGFICFHLLQIKRDRDFRAVTALLVILPMHFCRRAWSAMTRKGDYPLTLLLTELHGWIAGPFALWQSERRVQKLGRSHPMPAARTAGLGTTCSNDPRL